MIKPIILVIILSMVLSGCSGKLPEQFDDQIFAITLFSSTWFDGEPVKYPDYNICEQDPCFDEYIPLFDRNSR